MQFLLKSFEKCKVSVNLYFTFRLPFLIYFQDPLACVCGKSIFNQGVQPSNDCNVPCPTMSGDICGGHFRLAVYNISRY